MKRRLLSLLLLACLLFTCCTACRAVEKTDVPSPDPAPQVPSALQEKQPLLILMYHNFTEDDSETTSVTITAEKFEQDILWLKEHGYTFLLPQDWLDILAGRRERPAKPVMLTFDDGYLSNYTLAYPILQRHNAKAVISVVVSTIGKMENKFTWAQAREMVQSGLVDIQSHTYNLHNYLASGMTSTTIPNGILPYAAESPTRYAERLRSDLMTSKRIIEREVGNEVFFLCFPFGERHNWADPVLEECGFTMTCVTGQGEGNAGDPQFNLVRYNVDMQTSLPDLVQKNQESG